MLVRVLIATLILSLQVPTAFAQFAPDEIRVVDKSFRSGIIKGQTTATGIFDITFYFKAINQGGHLTACLGYITNGSIIAREGLSASLRNSDSYLIVGGRDDQGAPHLNPLAFAALSMPSKPDDEIKAGCIHTSHEWSSKYGQSHFYIHLARDYAR